MIPPTIEESTGGATGTATKGGGILKRIILKRLLLLAAMVAMVLLAVAIPAVASEANTGNLESLTSFVQDYSLIEKFEQGADSGGIDQSFSVSGSGGKSE